MPNEKLNESGVSEQESMARDMVALPYEQGKSLAAKSSGLSGGKSGLGQIIYVRDSESDHDSDEDPDDDLDI